MIFFLKSKFFHILVVSKIDGDKLFAEVLEKKEACKDYKNKFLGKTQN